MLWGELDNKFSLLVSIYFSNMSTNSSCSILRNFVKFTESNLITIPGSFVEKKRGNIRTSPPRDTPVLHPHKREPEGHGADLMEAKWQEKSQPDVQSGPYCIVVRKKWGYNPTYRGYNHSHAFIRGHL